MEEIVIQILDPTGVVAESYHMELDEICCPIGEVPDIMTRKNTRYKAVWYRMLIMTSQNYFLVNNNLEITDVIPR